MTKDTEMEVCHTKKQIAIQISKKILLEEKEKGNVYVPIIDGDKMEEIVKFSLEVVEKLTSMTNGQNLYELPYDTIVRKIMRQIMYCGPFYPQKKTLNLENFTVTSAEEISAMLSQKMVDVVELTTGYLITERTERNLLVPVQISDDDVMGIVMEIIKSREALKSLSNGTSIFEQNQQLLMDTIIEQIMDYIPSDTTNKTELPKELRIETEVKSVDDKKKSKKGKSPIRRLLGFFLSCVSRRQ